MPFLKADKDKEKVIEGVAKTSIKDRIMIDIKKVIMDKLGKIDNFYRIDIKEVGTHRFRVNVICKKNTPDNLIPFSSRPYSYYVIADATNNLSFNPLLP